MAQKDIKTRDLAAGSRVVDHTLALADRAKAASVRTRENADNKSESVSGSSADTLQDGVTDAARLARRQQRAAVSYAQDRLRERRVSGQETGGQERRNAEAPPSEPAANARRTAENPGPETAPGVSASSPQEQGRKLAVDEYRRRVTERSRGEVGAQSSRLAETDRRIEAKNADTVKAGVQRREETRLSQTGRVGWPGVRRAAGAYERRAVKTPAAAEAAAQQAAARGAEASARAAQASQKARQTAAKTARTAGKAIRATAKLAVRGVKSLAALLAAGGWLSVLVLVLVCLFGAVVCLFCGDGGSAHSELSVSPEVYAYEETIRKYAEQYGIPDYVPLIEAVMMTESGGQGDDPMQASACGYNKRFPGGITDPEYSIDCGVHYLADCLRAAKAEGPSDLAHIRLAVQGYNYGSGYIPWAVRRDGGYTDENAAAFSELMKSKLGVSVYGSPVYAQTVLRYYGYSYLLAGELGGSQMLISVAGNEVGYREGAGGYTKYGASFGLPDGEWCAMFVSWCAEQCNYVSAGVCPRLSYCPDIVKWFQARNLWFDGGITPPAGAYILFDWKSDGIADHVGLVEYVQDGVVHTIEGNSGRAVRRNSYKLGDKRIMGYGVPMFV